LNNRGGDDGVFRATMERSKKPVQAERRRYPNREGNGAQPKEPDKEHSEQTAEMETTGEPMAAIHVGGSSGKGPQETVEKTSGSS